MNISLFRVPRKTISRYRRRRAGIKGYSNSGRRGFAGKGPGLDWRHGHGCHPAGLKYALGYSSIDCSQRHEDVGLTILEDMWRVWLY